MKYKLNILGPFELLTETGEHLSLSSKKAQALLAVLALAEDNTRNRDSLTALLWADRGDEQARGSLRQALSALRRALGEDNGEGALRTSDQAVTLVPETVDCDLLEFRKACRQTDPEVLETGLRLCRGDLLAGFPVKDATFQDWLENQRRSLRADLEGLLGRLLEYYECEGQTGKAIAVAERLLTLDPYRESCHRAVMRLLAAAGERSRALQQYALCRDLLKNDLGTEPEPDTRELYESLRDSTSSDEAAAGQVVTQASSPAPAKGPRRRPGLAVLPFTSQGTDSDLQHLADELTREVINEVGRYSLITVAGAATMFAFRDRNADLLEVGRELGVDFILEGALRARGDRLRITSQLTDLSTDRQIWGDRFDSDLGQGFEEVDALVRRISGNLFQPLMRRASLKARSLAGEDRNIGTLFLRAYHNIERPTLEGNEEARRLCHEIISLDPEFPLVYELLAWVDIHGASNGWVEDPWKALQGARQAALRGIALNERDGYPRSALGFIEVLLGNFDRGLEELDAAVRLNPNDCEFWTFKGTGLGLVGRYLEALEALDEAWRLSPGYPPVDLFRGNAHLVAGKFAEALASYDRLLSVLNEYGWAVSCRSVCLVELGRLEEARQAIESLERESPYLSCSFVESLLRAQDSAFRARIISNLRQAGLRERAG